MAQRSTNWVFTLNNYTQEDETRIREAVEGGWLRWCVYGREVGASGTPHLQGGCGASSQRTMSAMRKRISDRAHWEPMRGRVDQATDYCKKDGDVVSLGSVPVRDEQVDKKPNSDEKYREIIKLSRERNLEEIERKYPTVYFLHYKRILQLGNYTTTRLGSQERPNIWYYGETGTGKSYRARRHGKVYLKKRNKWWDDYNDEEVVVIEEWAPCNEATAQELKIWADSYDFPAEVKGGTIRIRPRLLIVTSNYSMRTCFPRDEDYYPLKRRFTEIECISQEDQIVRE